VRRKRRERRRNEPWWYRAKQARRTTGINVYIVPSSLDLGEKDSGGGGLGFCREREGGEKVCREMKDVVFNWCDCPTNNADWLLTFDDNLVVLLY
jgi:hypothetical protein